MGDLAFGGIVFYVDPSGNHGLVAKETDEPDVYYFNVDTTEGPLQTYIPIGLLQNAIYGGKSNTNRIQYLDGLDQQYFNFYFEHQIWPAAAACFNLVHGGYDDWYLPSIGELDLMFRNLHLQGLGDFDVDDEVVYNNGFLICKGTYWSSSEASLIGGNPRPSILYFGDGIGGEPGPSYPGNISWVNSMGYAKHRVRAIRAF